MLANLILLAILAVITLLVYEAFKNGWNWQKAIAAVLALGASLAGIIAGFIHLPGVGQ